MLFFGFVLRGQELGMKHEEINECYNVLLQTKMSSLGFSEAVKKTTS